jgi:nitroreductase
MARSDSRLGRTGDRPLPPVPADSPPILQALRYGITAPSAHNTQPWRIEVDSALAARLFPDPARLLPATDPPGRQVLISHGTLLEVTSIAAAQLGYRTQIELQPEGPVTTAELGSRPTARLQLAAGAGPGADPLFGPVMRRRTSRFGYAATPVPADQRAAILEQAAMAGVRLDWVGARELPAALEIAIRAMAVEAGDPALFDETRRWFRFSGADIARAGDGLNLDTTGLAGASLALARLFTTPGRWHSARNRQAYLASFGRAVRATPALLMIATPGNDVADWIAAGRSYVRAQLEACRLGLCCHPVSQSLQEYPQMDALRAEMEELTGITPPGKLQLLVRVGNSRPPALSPRRELSAFAG